MNSLLFLQLFDQVSVQQVPKQQDMLSSILYAKVANGQAGRAYNNAMEYENIYIVPTPLVILTLSCCMREFQRLMNM